ncbi:MAG: D-aminoacylase [Betaproteobacteria bacterium]|jgi:N-acyl-D-amino-acid deacylase|nr:D-aminoacylase [Betaproteobacteria bacterium]
MIYDEVIENVWIHDGLGSPAQQADLAIQAGRIAEIRYGGHFFDQLQPSLEQSRHKTKGHARSPGMRAKERVDGMGMHLAPGFIDVHTHDDAALLLQPSMDFKVSQGVTTVVTGNCGVSIAPLPEGELAMPLGLVDVRGNPRFHRFQDYIEALHDQPAATHAVVLIGHSALRACTMDRLDREASASEVRAMQALLQHCLELGAAGASTGTFYPTAAKASTQEITQVLRPLCQCGGIFTTHMRDESEDLMASIEETIAIGKTLGVRTIISHHKCAGPLAHGQSTRSLARIEEAAKTIELGFDVYPYEASSTMLLADRAALSRKTVITSCPRFPQYEGDDFDQLSRDLGLEAKACADYLGPSAAVYFTMDEADVDRIVTHPQSMIGSDGIPLQGKPHPRLWGTFPRVLGRYVREKKLLSLPQAIRKMTGLSAARFGLDRGPLPRGRIAIDAAADLVLFDPQQVLDLADYDQPEQASRGIEATWVAGQRVYTGPVLAAAEGSSAGCRPARPGQILSGR